MNIIEVKGLSFSYEDGTAALKNVTLNFRKGRTTAVLGGNGAGKSTLFLNLNGLLKPSSGEIYFDGKKLEYDNKGLAEIKKRVGIVFQDPDDQLFCADVKKDVAYGPLMQGLPPGEAKERVDLAVSQTGIGELVDKPIHALSFGQKKRVAIAGILAMRPELIILDEPTAGLDPAGVSGLLNLLQGIKESTGISVILSTHDIDLVSLYCDEACLLDKGSVIFEGTPGRLFAEPSLLRSHRLRLPRIAHLMSILNKYDQLPVDKSAATISMARKSINELFASTGGKK